MVRVTMTGFGIGCRNCYVSETETPNGILKYFHLDPNKKIVYVNGEILSRRRMETQIGKKGHVYMIVKDKIRD